MQSRNITQLQLASDAKIDYNTLRKVETGSTKNPSFDFVMKMAEALNINIDTFKEPTAMTTMINCDTFYNLKLMGILVKEKELEK